MTAFNDEDNSDEEGNSSQECQREQRMEERREKRSGGWRWRLDVQSPGFYRILKGRIRNSTYLSGNGTFDGWDGNELRQKVRK